MESENLNLEEQEIVVEPNEQESSLHRVTPFSKYLAMLLFILMPFIGGWIGYQYAPEKVIEVERVVEVENIREVTRAINIPASVVKIKSLEKEPSASDFSSPSVVLDLNKEKIIYGSNPQSCGGKNFTLTFSSVGVERMTVELVAKSTTTDVSFREYLDLSSYASSTIVGHTLEMSPSLILGTSDYFSLLKAAGKPVEYSVVFHNRETDEVLLEENIRFMIIPIIADC